MKRGGRGHACGQAVFDRQLRDREAICGYNPVAGGVAAATSKEKPSEGSAEGSGSFPRGRERRSKQYGVSGLRFRASDTGQVVAVLSQLRNLDSLRLYQKIGHIDADLLSRIKKTATRMNFG